MPIPMISNVGPDAPDVINALSRINDITKQNLANQLASQQNQYYAPNIQSEIAQRNALTQGQNIQNQYMPEHLRLANELAASTNPLAAPNIQSEIASRNATTQKTLAMTPLEVAKAKMENDIFLRNKETENALKQAQIDYYLHGGGKGSVEQKDIQAFGNQLRIDNPINPDETQPEYAKRINQIQNAYLSGDNTLPNGEILPKLSGTANDLRTSIFNRHVPVAVRNQLSSMDSLVGDLKSFDIDAVKSFSGAKGRVKLAYAKSQMLLNPDDPNIDPMARRYLSTLNQSIINMDKMRKTFGTSVVPDYVYSTVGRLTNPNDSIYNDATQIEKNYKGVIDTITRDRNSLRNQYKRGLLAGEEDEGNASPSTASPDSSTPEIERIESPDGRRASGPPDKIALFLKDHPNWKKV